MPDSSPCRSATFSALSDRSIPVTFAPFLTIDSVRIPPPQPISSTFLPLSWVRAWIHSSRSGLISCRGRNSDVGSHQRWASSLNFWISSGSAFIRGIITGISLARRTPGRKFPPPSPHPRRRTASGRKKTPPQRGFFHGTGRTFSNYLLRVPTTSTSTRRFLARPAAVLLSATGCFSPLPSVYTRFASIPLLSR